MLTFPEKIDTMWKRPFTASKTLFILNRFSIILCYVLIVTDEFGDRLDYEVRVCIDPMKYVLTLVMTEVC